MPNPPPLERLTIAHWSCWQSLSASSSAVWSSRRHRLDANPDMSTALRLSKGARQYNSLDFGRRHAWLFSLASMPHFEFKRLRL